MSVAHSTKTCPFEGCGRIITSKGLCSAHYAQRKRGKELTPVFSTRRSPGGPRRPDQKCAHCENPGTELFKQGYYCVVHYRIKQMRYDAQASGKTIPEATEISSMMDHWIENGLLCPVCKRKMNWLKKEGISTMLTLQHDRSGQYRLICLGCNVRHQNYPGDTFYDLPAGQEWCRTCEKTKPISDFYPRKSSRLGIRSSCRECEKAAVNDYHRRQRNEGV